MLPRWHHEVTRELPELAEGGREKFAADQAAQAADAAKQMAEAVPPVPAAGGAGGAGPKGPASPRTSGSGKSKLSELKEWDSTLHPRVPRGSGDPSGEFTAKGGTAPLDLPTGGLGLHMASLPKPVQAKIEAFEAQQQRPVRELFEALLAGQPEPPAARAAFDVIVATIAGLQAVRAAISAAATAQALAAIEWPPKGGA